MNKSLHIGNLGGLRLDSVAMVTAPQNSCLAEWQTLQSNPGTVGEEVLAEDPEDYPLRFLRILVTP